MTTSSPMQYDIPMEMTTMESVRDKADELSCKVSERGREQVE